jgi:hypothetical protein
VLLLLDVVSLRTDTHQGGSRIPHFPFFFFFPPLILFFLSYPIVRLLPSNSHDTNYERVYTYTDFLLCRFFFSLFEIHLYYVDRRQTSALSYEI